MGIKLVVDVLDNAPGDLTPAERLLLVALAEDARDETRVCWPGMDKLVRRTGLQEDSVRRVFQRLAKRGLEVRVPIGVDKKGRPVFARENVRTNYRLPVFPVRWDQDPPSSEGGSESRQSGGTSVPPGSRDEDPPTLFEAGPQSPPEAGPQSPPSPQPPQEKKNKPSSSRSKKTKTDIPPREDVELLCTRLLEWAIKKDYGGRPDAVPDEWRTEARLLLDKNKVRLQDALDVLDWSQRDPFWRGVLHAMPKFRKKYADLEFKSRGLRGDSGRPQQQFTAARASAPGANPSQFTEDDFNDPNFG